MTEKSDGVHYDRIKHLELIQAVILRMSTASGNAKNWLLPLATATYGFAFTNQSMAVAVLGILAVTILMFLDVSYLRAERSYRKLYELIAAGHRVVPPYSLDTKAVPSSGRGASVSGCVQRLISPLMSWSIAPFYGSLIGVGVAILVTVK